MFGIQNFTLTTLVGVMSCFLQATNAQVELPVLQYAQDALEPYISAETISYHYGKHHQGYVDNTNTYIEADDSLKNLSLWKLMRKTEGTIFNNVAQVYNHNLYWESLSPDGGGEPTGDLLDAIEYSFGDFDTFKTNFTSAAGHFGSGWAWLYIDLDGNLDVVDSSDASNPVAEELGYPVIVCDIWEHAYYIDHRNSRGEYITGFWELVNWTFASTEYARLMNKKFSRV